MTVLRAEFHDIRHAGARRWALFTIGNALIAVGISFMLLSARGTGPIDAATAGAAGVTGLTIGTWAILAACALLAFAALLGYRPRLGTIVSFIIVGVLIDLTLTTLAATAPTTTVSAWVLWLAGGVLLAAGAGATIGADLGASAYDQATLAIASRFRNRLWLGRIILDLAAAAIALILGGPLGWGTAALMILMPTLMPPSVNLARRYAHPNLATT